MNPTLIAEYRDLVQKLSLISHVTSVNYEGKIARDTSEATGGRRPTGSDIEPKPRRPKSPRIVGNIASEKAWDEYEIDLAAWEACYHRRGVDYFVRRFAACSTDGMLRDLIGEARDTLAAWKRTPIPKGQPPALGDPQWKRWVAESSLQTGDLARMFSVSRQYIQKIRRGYRDAA